MEPGVFTVNLVVGSAPANPIMLGGFAISVMMDTTISLSASHVTAVSVVLCPMFVMLSQGSVRVRATMVDARVTSVAMAIIVIQNVCTVAVMSGERCLVSVTNQLASVFVRKATLESDVIAVWQVTMATLTAGHATAVRLAVLLPYVMLQGSVLACTTLLDEHVTSAALVTTSILSVCPADVRIQDQLECHVTVKVNASARTTLMGIAVRSAKRASTITPSVKSATVTLLVCLLHLPAVGHYHRVNFASAKIECTDESAMSVGHCSGIFKPQIQKAVKNVTVTFLV
jgi:hypothetical protein